MAGEPPYPGGGVAMRRWAWAAGALAVVLAGLFVFWLRERPLPPSRLGGYLPACPTEFFVDVRLLRQSGLLDKISGSPEEFDAEYRGFLAETGFDFAKDLDYVRAGFSSDNRYFILTGRFRWDKVAAYSKKRGGTCSKKDCQVEESGQRIRIVEIRSEMLGISIGRSPGPFQYKERAESGVGAPVWLTTTGRELVMSRFWPSALSGPIAEVMASASAVRFQGEAARVKIEADFPDPSRARVAASFVQSLLEAGRQHQDASLAKAARGAKVTQRETTLEVSIPVDLR